MRLRLQHRTYIRPFRAAIRTGHGLWSHREGVLICLENEAGRTGFGEMAPIPGFGNESSVDLVARFGSLGEYATRDALANAFPAGPGRFAVDAALRQLGALPALTRLHDSLPVAALLPAGRRARSVLGERLEQGFRTFKWKVGVESAADELAMLDELLGDLPTGARLRLDANGSWDRRTAERWLNASAERPIDYVEQPAPASDTDLLLGLANDYPTPLALDEAISTETDFEFWLGEGWPGVWVVKPALLGAPADWIANLRARRARVVLSSALEGPIARRAALEFAFADPGTPEPIGFGVGHVFADDSWNAGDPRPFLFASELERLDASALWTDAR
ncbi:o-succinylbenzoate synthase [Nibricoccus sp. IMCC34717]|uniref:o-succinylbenzoate synthase n=1 Tax=Nibricoccus sp. IMCC34717 TaxID=3034021 RepID=UPI003850EE0A